MRRTLAEGAKLAAVIILVGILVFSSLSSFFSIISMARADSTHTASSGEDLDRAVNYLYVNYDNTVGLIRESPDPEFENNYWVYSDNCLASLVLSNYDQSNLTLTGRAEDITNKMPYYLSQAGICNPMNLYMALTASVFYFDNAQPVILAKVGDATVKTTMNNRIGDPLLPWNYSDVAFLQAIEETWWEIIQKYSVSISIADENGNSVVAKVPQEFASLKTTNRNGWKVYYKENVEVEISGGTFRIKRLHMLVPPEGAVLRDELRGVSIHRRGMKVGPIRLSGVPDQIGDRYFGYVQLNPDFENLIAGAENTTHYGFTSRHKPAYKELKRTLQEHQDLFMQQLGFRSAARDADERARRTLDEAKADLDSILSGMGVPGFGGGRPSGDELSLTVKGLVFPNGSPYLGMGMSIAGFWFRVTNRLQSPQTVWVEVFTREREAGVIETLSPRTKIELTNEINTDKLTLTLKEGVYPRGRKIGCTARVTNEAGDRLGEKTFHIYLEMPAPPDERLAEISLTSAEWPRPNSRRVDFDQKISNLAYEIENLTAHQMKAKVKVGTIWEAERERIEDVFGIEVDLNAYEKEQFTVPEVKMTRGRYTEIGRGKMLLRCHAVATESTSEWEKGKRLDEHDVVFYLNTDPAYGFFEEAVYSSDGPTKPRSRARPVEGLQRWSIEINNTHPAFRAVFGDEELTKDYIFEEMARQTVFVLLTRDQVPALRRLTDLGTTDEISEMEPEEILQQIAYAATDRILAQYYGG